MEDTLLVTLDTAKRSMLLYLSNVAKSRPGQSWLDIDILEEALDERLGRERKPLLYLVESY